LINLFCLLCFILGKHLVILCSYSFVSLGGLKWHTVAKLTYKGLSQYMVDYAGT